MILMDDEEVDPGYRRSMLDRWGILPFAK